MARTILDIPLRGDPAAADSVVKTILINDGYRDVPYNAEIVWKKGTGMMTAMHYIKVEYMGNVLRLSGWVQIGVGALGGKERDLSGFTATVPKKSVKKTMEKIQAAVAGM
jgi:hypothetical protein